jgi:hypothetical protein
MDAKGLARNYMQANHRLMTKYAELMQANGLLQQNIKMLSNYIEKMYDLSGNSGPVCTLNITTYDICGNLLTCVTTDSSGNFVPCTGLDAKGNYIPCVLPPDLSGGFASREFPCYPYPYYPYPYPYGPPLLFDDDMDYRSMDRELPIPTPPIKHEIPKDRDLLDYPYLYPYGPYPYDPYPYGPYGYGSYPYRYGSYPYWRDMKTPQKIVSLPAEYHDQANPNIMVRPVKTPPLIYSPPSNAESSNVHIHIHPSLLSAKQ